MENDKLRKITLVTTEMCNLGCRYCYEVHKKNSFMSVETAKHVIDHEMARFPVDYEIQVEMIGGEPFLGKAFDLFKWVVEYVLDEYHERKVHFVVTTNGTFVHGEVQEFLMKYSMWIVLSLSLDGKQKSHDMNRPHIDGSGSFKDIDIAFFQKYPVPVNAKMTVSPATMKYLAEDIEYVESLGLIPTATLATGIEWEKEFHENELISQLEILVNKYSVNIDAPLPAFLQVELERVFCKSDPKIKPCGAGEITRSFTPECVNDVGDLDWYPCQGLAPISVGVKKAEQFKNCCFEGFTLNEPCASCRFKALCPACQATNFGSTGSVSQQSPTMCVLNRILALASSTIQYNRIVARGVTDKDQVTLKAIELIQNEIFDTSKHQFLLNVDLMKGGE